MNRYIAAFVNPLLALVFLAVLHLPSVSTHRHVKI
uniref:Uncharacterized protein n=1 Tax=Rhizophora mucronata TaxID=61149 RepID=A0A2P2Q0T0_RHIMU